MNFSINLRLWGSCELGTKWFLGIILVTDSSHDGFWRKPFLCLLDLVVIALEYIQISDFYHERYSLKTFTFAMAYHNKQVAKREQTSSLEMIRKTLLRSMSVNDSRAKIKSAEQQRFQILESVYSSSMSSRLLWKQEKSSHRKILKVKISKLFFVYGGKLFIRATHVSKAKIFLSSSWV